MYTNYKIFDRLHLYLLLILILLYLPVSIGQAKTFENNIKQCKNSNILCVDVNKGPTQEYKTIQAAALDVMPGQTILVFDGEYAGFQFGRDRYGEDINGIIDERITIKAVGNSASITSPFVEQTTDIDKKISRNCGIAIIFGGDYLTIDGLRIVMPKPDRPGDIHSAGYHGPGICNDGHIPGVNPLTSLELLNLVIIGAGDKGVVCGHCSNVNWSGNLIKDTYRIGRIGGHGLYLANGDSDHGKIVNNRIYNNDGNGIHTNGDVNHNSDGLITELLVDSNIIYDNGWSYKDSNGGVGINMDGVQHALIRNNLVFNNFSSAIKAYRVDGAEGPKDIAIVNNTLISKNRAIFFVNKEDGDDQGGHVIFNNILVGNTADYGSVSILSKSILSDYNIVVNDFSLLGILRRKIGFNKSKQSTGDDQHSLKAFSINGIFMNPDKNDFRLKTGSPAIGHGIKQLGKIKAPITDMANNDRSANDKVDIGALMFDAAAN